MRSSSSIRQHTADPALIHRRVLRRKSQLRAFLNGLNADRARWSSSQRAFHESLLDAIADDMVALAQHEKNGTWRPWEPRHFTTSDEVYVRGHWYRVMSVNDRSLTHRAVATAVDPDAVGNDRTTYPYVGGRRRDGHAMHLAPLDT